MHTDFAHSAATANTQPPMPPPHASTSHSGATPTGFARSTNRLGREDTKPTSATLLEVAQSDQPHLRQALLALETIESDALLLPSPDLDQMQVANISDDQTIEVTNIVRRLLSVQRIFGGQGTVMLIRSTSKTNTDEDGDSIATVDAIAYFGGEPGGLSRILLYSLSARQWLVQHLSIYVLQRLHSHFQYGIVFETPALRFPLKPLNNEFTAETRSRIAKKWTSNRLGDRLLAIEKLGHLMPELYFDVVNQFLRGKAVGSVDSAFGFAIVIPSVSFAQEKLVHLPYFRERRSYR